MSLELTINLFSRKQYIVELHETHYIRDFEFIVSRRRFLQKISSQLIQDIHTNLTIHIAIETPILP